MAPDNHPGATRRQLLQLTAATTATGFAGCVGSGDGNPEGGVTIIEERTSPENATTGAGGTTGTATPEPTGTASPDETPTDTDEPETATEDDESDPTETEPDDTEPGDSRQLRIISAEGTAAFDYSFTIDGDAELVTTGEYSAVPKEETANNRGEEIVENDDGTVTIKGVVADGGGDTFRITGDIVDSVIQGEAAVYLDGELVEETDPQPDDSTCVTIDEPGEYVLTQDVESSADVCIDIRADDVVFDGDGHTLSGSSRQGTGIAVSGSNVTVQNVTVSGFAAGIEPEGARVRRCVATENGTGIRYVAPGAVGRVVECEIADNERDGIDIEAAEGDRLRVLRNEIVSNGRHGVWATAVDVDIHENVIDGNGGWGVLAEDGAASLDSNEVTRNAAGVHLVGRGGLDNEIVADNQGTGVLIDGEAELWATSIRDNDGDGLSVAAAPNASGSARLERCRITGNGANGIVADVDLAVRESNLGGNAGYGVRNEAEGVADARNNFWGDETGPSSPDDPDAPFRDPAEDEYADGDGDAVSESDTPGVANVRFAPWRETEI